MEYLTQPNAKEEARKKIKSVTDRLDWAWDFKNVFLLIINEKMLLLIANDPIQASHKN